MKRKLSDLLPKGEVKDLLGLNFSAGRAAPDLEGEVRKLREGLQEAQAELELICEVMATAPEDPVERKVAKGYVRGVLDLADFCERIADAGLVHLDDIRSYVGRRRG